VFAQPLSESMMMEQSGVEASMHNPAPQQTQEEVPVPTTEEQFFFFFFLLDQQFM
jgi:hypothetical protein